MKFWRVTYMIKNAEKTYLVSADENCSKDKVIKTLQEIHPKWIDLKITRTRKPKGSYLFQKEPERPRKLQHRPEDW